MINKTQDEITRTWTKSNGNEILVSISCTTYNHVNYIEQCLDGFLCQKTYFPFEILIHDDCSTDGTTEIIQKYTAKYPDIIKPIYETENQYQQGKNVGSLIWNNPRAKGKYIAFCEGDDYWIDNNKLQEQVNFLENNDSYGMVYTNFNLYYQDKKLFVNNCFDLGKSNFNSTYNNVNEWIENLGYLAPMTWLYKKQLIIDGLHNYEELFLYSPDTTFIMFAYFLQFAKVKYINNTTAVYRVLQNSASHSKDINKLFERNKALYNTQLKMIKQFGLTKEMEENITKKYYRINFKYLILLNKQEELLNYKIFDKKLSISKKILISLSKNSVIRFILNKIYVEYKKHDKY